jgi:hypothetical protein
MVGWYQQPAFAKESHMRTTVLPRDLQPGDKIDRLTSGDHFLPGPEMLRAEEMGVYQATVKSVEKIKPYAHHTAYRVRFTDYDDLPENRQPWAQYRYLRPIVFQPTQKITVEREA